MIRWHGYANIRPRGVASSASLAAAVHGVAKSALLRWHGNANIRPLPCSASSPQSLRFEGTPRVSSPPLVHAAAPPFPRKEVACSRPKPLQARAFYVRSRFVLFAGCRLRRHFTRVLVVAFSCLSLWERWTSAASSERASAASQTALTSKAGVQKMIVCFFSIASLLRLFREKQPLCGLFTPACALCFSQVARLSPRSSAVPACSASGHRGRSRLSCQRRFSVCALQCCKMWYTKTKIVELRRVPKIFTIDP